jgi:hypothetical protein
LLDDATALATLLFLEGSRPARPSGRSSEVLRDLEVVEPAEPPLEGPQGTRRGDGLHRGESDRQVREVSPVPHPNTEAVEASSGRLAASPAVCVPDLLSALVADPVKVPVEVPNPVPRRVGVESGADALEQARVPFGAQEYPEQLASDPSVIAEPPSDLREAGALPGPPRQGSVGEEAQGDVAVPDPSDQARESLQPPLVPLELAPGGFREESGPDDDPDPQTAEVTVQPVEGRGGRSGRNDEPVQLVERQVQAVLELLDELGDGARWRAWAGHRNSGKGSNPNGRKTVSQPASGDFALVVLVARGMHERGALPVGRGRR